MFKVVFFILLISIAGKFASDFIYKNIKTNKNNIAFEPHYYGYCIIMWNFVAMIIVIILDKFFSLKTNYLFEAISLVIIISLTIIGAFKLNNKFNAQHHFEVMIKALMGFSSLVSIIITISILLTISWQALRFFKEVPIFNFLFGSNWNPQNEIDSLATQSFGVMPVFFGTAMVTIIALVIAIPIGILSAVQLNEYSNKFFRKKIKALIEILAGIPTVVYGYFAITMVAPAISHVGQFLGIFVSSESSLTVGLVMGIMITPYIVTLADDALNFVPKTLKHGAYALGFTKSETIKYIIIPAATPGIYSAILLAVSRVIGETMIVTMAAGLHAYMTINPLESVTTATVQIVALLTGDQEFNNNKTLAAFALAFILFIMTFLLNIIAHTLLNKRNN